MSERYRHVLAAVQRYPWAIADEMWAVIQGLLELRAAGDRLTPEEILAAIGAERVRPEPQQLGAVAVLPLRGVMAQHMDGLMEMSGGVSTDRYARDVRAALAESSVEALLLDIHSPGGSIYGVEELAAIIRAGRAKKPIVAVANSLIGSAAYWVASAASEIVAAPNSDVGSIGVFGVHRDASKIYDQVGLKLTVIKAGKYKAEGGDHEPLSDEVRERIQARVDAAYDDFLSAIAKGRGVKKSEVRDGYGEGQVLGARAALAAGMVDRIATAQDTLDRLSTKQGRQAVLQATSLRASETTPQEPATPATGQESSGRLRDEWLRTELDTL
ncbi:MAG: signal peptide peptidase SppA [Acidobacteria bacterium]|nr:signal peptide peptidase SppA [Acidobacteriota bacterium]